MYRLYTIERSDLNVSFYIIIFLFLGIVCAQAQEAAYINRTDILLEMPEAKEVESQLIAMRADLVKEGDRMFETFKSDYARIQEMEAQGELSPVQLEEKVKVLQEEEMKITEFRKGIEIQLMQKQNELLQPILNKISQAVADVAKEHGYYMVFDASTQWFVHADSTNDLTELVRQQLGIQ